MMWSNAKPHMLVCRYFSEVCLNNSQPFPSETLLKVVLLQNRLHTNAAGEQAFKSTHNAVCG